MDVKTHMDRIVRALADRNLMAVSRATGIDHRTLHRIAKGQIKDPKVSHFVKLREYLRTGV